MRKIINFPNGAKIIYRKNKQNKATVAEIGFFAGFKYSRDGVPHFLEHMLMKETNKRTENQVLDDKANIAFVNGATSKDRLFVDFHKSTRKIEECFEFASDLLLNFHISEDRFETEKSIILEEKCRSIDSRSKRIGAHHFHFYCPQVGTIEEFQNGVFGENEFIKNLTINDLEAYAKKHFVSNKFIMFILTSASKRKVIKLAKKYFINKLDKNDEVSIPFSVEKITGQEGLNIVKNQDSAIKCKLTLKVDTTEVKYKYNYAPRVLDFVMNKRNNLFKYSVRKSGLSYDPDYSFDLRGNQDDLVVGIEFTTSKEENIAQIISIFGDSIKSIKETGVFEKELETFKINKKLSEDLELPIDRDRLLSLMVNTYAEIGEEKPKSNRFYKKLLKKCSVSDCNECINRFFNKNNDLHITIMGNVDENKLLSIEEYRNLVFKD